MYLLVLNYLQNRNNLNNGACLREIQILYRVSDIYPNIPERKNEIKRHNSTEKRG